MRIFTKIICLCFVITLSACLGGGNDKEVITIENPDGRQFFFSVDVADTPETQQRGLMFIEDMPHDEGMIFVYDQPMIALFWMKNTLIPLDMLFFDENNKLIHIEHSATPSDETPRGPRSTPVCSVVEINGGVALSAGIEKGAKLLTDLTQECLQSGNN
jgi:uncharacterized membrane protein (UPF0127 family)